MRSIGITPVAVAALLSLLIGLGGVAAGQNSDKPTSSGGTGAVGPSVGTTTTVNPGSTTITDTGRPRIAVWPFENPPSYFSSTIGDGLTSIVITQLTQSGRFEVIQSAEDLESMVTDVDNGGSGYVGPERAMEMGHVLGIDYVLTGQVIDFGYEERSTGGFIGAAGESGRMNASSEEAVVRLSFSLIDAETGETVLAATAESRESESGAIISGSDWNNWIAGVGFDSQEFQDSMVGRATMKAVRSLMDQMLRLFPIQARILAVTPDFVILGIGSGLGIETGMEFEVYRVSAVTNSNGTVVWQDRELVGRVRVMEVQLSNCKAEVISGSDIREGDLCIMPEKPEETGD